MSFSLLPEDDLVKVEVLAILTNLQPLGQLCACSEHFYSVHKAFFDGKTRIWPPFGQELSSSSTRNFEKF